MAGNDDGAGTEGDRPDIDAIEEFGPEEFEAMTPEEWTEAFDPDSWITGPDLLDRVESELRHRIEQRDVFAVLERIVHDGEECLVAYADNGYALLHPSGDLEGFGTVLRDVKPTVALCSIPEYEVEPADGTIGTLPAPETIEIAGGDFGNKMIQVVGYALLLSTLVLIGGWLFFGVPLVGAIIGVIFGIVAVFLLFTVANARLSNRYRAQAYRERLRSTGLGDGERPSFVPEDEAVESQESTDSDG